jgi:hypothetical protein
MAKQIQVPILNNEYSVIVCWGKPATVEKVLKQWKHTKKSQGWAVDCFDDSRGLCFTSNGAHPVIALPRLPRTNEEIGTLAHEATHAVEHIFSHIKQPLGGEIFAHSVGAVVRETLNAVKK